jgi:hypothetical protein
MTKRVIEADGKDELPVKQNRNRGLTSQVYGISGSIEFWDKVEQVSDETGMGRSAVIVETLTLYWKLKGVNTRSVGRPRKKTVKSTR